MTGTDTETDVDFNNQFSYSNLIVDHLGLHKGSVTEGFNCSKITRSSITFHFIPDY